MKILLACEIFPPDIGGPATYAMDLALWMKENHYDFEVLCCGDDTQSYDFTITRISRKSFVLIRYVRYFLKLFFLAKKFDVIYAQGPISSGIPAYLVNNILGKKYAVKVVGDYAWESARNSNATEMGIDNFQKIKMVGKTGILQYLERLTVKNAHAVIVPSNYLKNIVMGWGVKENKINVIYNSFVPEEITSDVSVNPNSIVTTGRLVPWKGFSTLIKIMPKLLEINKNFILNIYGSGPDEGKLLRLIKEARLENKVFLSCQTRQNIMKSVRGAGIFILNTGYEGLSHTLLECLSAGIPIVTTNIGGNPEVIEDGKTGLLVEYDNEDQIVEAVKKIYSDPKLKELFKTNAKDILKKFEKEKMMSSTIKILENV